jgi:ABC-type branched-subunit amino acid transport system substrate-binding protein
VVVGNQWGPIINNLKNKGIRWLSDVTFLADTEQMLQAMQDAGFKPDVIDLGQQYYDETLPGKPGSEGVLVLTNTAPFEDAGNKAMQVYKTALQQHSPKTPPTTLGVSAFSAGLLFAQAAGSLGKDLTRDGLLKALQAIKKWDGGGLQMRTDPGDNKPMDCFMYMRVEHGRFVRYWPASPTDGTNGFDCNPDYVVHLPNQHVKLPPGWPTSG